MLLLGKGEEYQTLDFCDHPQEMGDSSLPWIEFLFSSNYQITIRVLGKGRRVDSELMGRSFRKCWRRRG